MNRPTPGAALLGSRMRQPCSANAARRPEAKLPGSVPFGCSTRRACCTMAPGAIRPVAGRASSPISTRGPMMEGVAIRSGSTCNSPRTVKLALPRRTTSPVFRPSRSSTTRSASRPRFARASATDAAGTRTASPTIGQAWSTAFSSTRRRSLPAPFSPVLISIERIRRISDVRAPRAANQSCRLAGKGWEPPSISRSPPRMRRPSCSMPRSVASRSVPTPAITATPSAKQASTIPRPRALPVNAPRSSRHARRKTNLMTGPVPRLARGRRRYARSVSTGRRVWGHG